MPCYSPLKACLVKTPSGEKISFRRDSVGRALTLPCGKCSGCLAERSRQWAVRLSHEVQSHDSSSFITLTYEKLPSKGSLCKRDAQLFLKRLRAKISPVTIRFFLCGEYGSKLGRPHYHALIFGYCFPDKQLWKSSKAGNLYRSDLLDDVWGKGYCSVGEVSYASALYVAKYSTKRVVGDAAKAHYKGLLPEFCLMSRGGRTGRGGIGSEWIDKFTSDVYPSDEVIINGFPARPPRYYDVRLEKKHPELLESLKAKRSQAAFAAEELCAGHKVPFLYERLDAKRRIATAKAALKSSTLE